MKHLVTTLMLWTLCFNVQAQLYIDNSSNLPDNGAKGQSMDVVAVDLDLDDDIDVVLANEFQTNTILYNNGLGQFVTADPHVLPQLVHDSEDVVAVDLNGDGFPDLVFCSEDDVNLGLSNVHEYFLFDGLSYITSGYSPPDSEANALISFDLNEDDHQDLFFGNAGPVTCLINNGEGSFLDESFRFPSLSRTTQDLLAIDIEDDRDFDLFEANEDGNVLYINDGSGNYTDESESRLPQGLNIETRKASMGDVDNDGDPDIFLSNVEFITGKDRQNRLFINDGNGVFTDETSKRLPVDNDHTIDAIFEDVDLDGDLDLFVANVFGSRIKVYINDGLGYFTDKTDEILGESYFRDALGLVAADFDDDGLNDIYICDRNVSSGNKDLLLTRKNTTAVDVSQIASKVNIFPSPTTDTVNIEFPEGVFNLIDLYNANGKKIKSTPIENLQIQHQLNLKSQLGLTPGNYFIKLIGEKEITKTLILIN